MPLLPAWMKSKNFRITFRVLVAISLPFLFILEENWRGKHEFEFYKRKLEARGEHLDFDWFLGPPVPDDKNFALNPSFAPLYDYTVDLATGDRIYKDPGALAFTISINGRSSASGPVFPKGNGGWQTGQMRDLETWQKYYRSEFPKLGLSKSPAEDVLAALAQYDGYLSQLREADATRPESRFPPKFEPTDSGAPRYSTFDNTQAVLSQRAVAELRLGRTDEAFTDVKLGFRITESLHDCPSLMAGAMRCDLMRILMQPVWEGIASHQWTDAQLQQIGAMLQKEDFLADFGFAVRSERAGLALMWEAMRTDPCFAERFAYTAGVTRSAGNPVKFMRVFTAISWQNEVCEFRLIQESVLPLVNVKARRVDVRAASALVGMRGNFSPYEVFARIEVPIYGIMVKSYASTQTSVDEARVACEIERYRLAHGSLPAKLADLGLPAIPCDVIDGKPLRYLLLAPDDYRLYSIGWNETDDGGTMVRNGPSGGVNLNEGDWVWSLKPL